MCLHQLLQKYLIALLLLLQPSGAAGAQVVHAQPRNVTAASPEVVAISTGQGVRAVTPVTAPAVASPTLSPVQPQTRPLVTPGNYGKGKPGFVLWLLVITQ